MKVTILLDTNFLLMMARGSIPPSSIGDVVKASYAMVTTSAVVKELELIKGHGDLIAREASFAFQLIERLGVTVVDVKAAEADRSLLLLASSMKERGETVIVATSDKGLRRLLRKAGVPTLYYREEGSTIEIEWEPLS
ncbi:MAG: PIN domain-containing protein [Acidilobus sp.]